MFGAVINSLNNVLIRYGWALAPYPAPPTEYFLESYALASSLVRETRDVDGCIVECGVAFGRGLLALMHAEKKFGRDRHVYGFDTFAGYPAVADRDVASIKLKPGRVSGTLKRGGLSWSQSDTLRFIHGSGIKASEVKNRLTLIQGDVAETLPPFTAEKVALAILEMDLYQSTKSALNALREKMAKGGIIVPLNYGSKFGASTEAVHEVFPDATLHPCPTMADKVMIRF